MFSMLRPEATEVAFSSRIAVPFSSTEWSSWCFISSQLVRLPPSRSLRIRTRTKLPCSRLPSSVNFKSPFFSASSGDFRPSGSQ